MVIVGMILCSLFLVAVWRVNFEGTAAERETDAVSVADAAPVKVRS